MASAVSVGGLFAQGRAPQNRAAAAAHHPASAAATRLRRRTVSAGRLRAQTAAAGCDVGADVAVGGGGEHALQVFGAFVGELRRTIDDAIAKHEDKECRACSAALARAGVADGPTDGNACKHGLSNMSRCTSVHVSVRMCARMFVHISVHMSVYPHVCTHVCVHAYLHKNLH